MPVKDLFGNISHKKHIWKNLWETKGRAQQKSDAHETAFIWIHRLQNIIQLTSGTLVSTSTLWSATTRSTTALVLNVIAILLQVAEAVSNLETLKLEHKQSSEKYKFIQGEIDRTMSVKRSHSQFVEVMDVISIMINTADLNSPSIPYFIRRRTRPIDSLEPPIPSSPENSVKQTGHRRHLTHSSPVLSSHYLTSKLFSDSNNVGRFLVDIEGHISDIDINLCYLSGMSETEIISLSGFGWITKLHRDEASLIWTKWTQSVNDKSRFLEKFRFVHPHDNIVYCIGESYPKFSKQNGTFIGMEGVILNIPYRVWEEFNVLEV